MNEGAEGLADTADFATRSNALALGVDPVEADDRVRPWVRRTPVMKLAKGSFGLEHDIVAKLECLQHAGSFKARGSFNSALAAKIPQAGLIAASGGNHGQAVAYVARALGLAVEIFLPSASSPVKVQRIRQLGAKVTVVGDLYDDARLACNERSAETGALNIHPYDAPLTVAGQGTVGLELMAQVDRFDTVLVAVGGGGLIAGMAAALPDSTRIIGVEPDGSHCLHSAIEVGGPVDVEIESVAADSLGAKRIGSLPWAIVGSRVESVVVPDREIIEARQMIWDDARLAVEAGGATALAALASGAYRPSSDERVVVVLCGSNTDPHDLIDRV